MSNISVRKREGEALSALESLGPLRVMQRLLGWDPFREMAALAPVEEPATFNFVPAFEVKETKDAYEFRADLPGVAEGDVEITISGNRLTISGKREAEAAQPNDTYFAKERAYGSFVRSFTLPDGADPEHVTATLSNGVLVVTVPKKQETQAKKIAVTSSPQQPR